jgi:hypothetical protein
MKSQRKSCNGLAVSGEEDAEESLTSDFIPNENDEAQNSGAVENSESEIRGTSRDLR